MSQGIDCCWMRDKSVLDGRKGVHASARAVDSIPAGHDRGFSPFMGARFYRRLDDDRTYALGLTNLSSQQCPCASVACDVRCPDNGGATPPASIGNNYYCESANNQCAWNDFRTFFPTRLFSSRPAFQRDLPSTVADIEVRVCLSQAVNAEDIFFDMLELYVS
jgi:hypothetical protein